MLLDTGKEKQIITFYSDSQASLAALNKLTIKFDTVEKCLNTLNELGNKNKVHLRWVKAHVGIPGNEQISWQREVHHLEMGLHMNC